MVLILLTFFVVFINRLINGKELSVSLRKLVLTNTTGAENEDSKK